MDKSDKSKSKNKRQESQEESPAECSNKSRQVYQKRIEKPSNDNEPATWNTENELTIQNKNVVTSRIQRISFNENELITRNTRILSISSFQSKNVKTEKSLESNIHEGITNFDK